MIEVKRTDPRRGEISYRLPEELNPIGCARLVQEIILDALTSNRFDSGGRHFSGRHPESMATKIRERARSTAAFAHSPITVHFSDAFGYDIERIRKSLLDRSLQLLNLAHRLENGI